MLFNRVNGKSQINEPDLYPGIVLLLEKLKQSKVKLALCSSSKNARFIMETLGINHCFDVVITGSDIINTKPHPEIFSTVSEKLAVSPVHCLVFEDACSGVKAAHAANMKCIGVGSKQDLPNADDWVTDYCQIDIPTLLKCGHSVPL